MRVVPLADADRFSKPAARPFEDAGRVHAIEVGLQRGELGGGEVAPYLDPVFARRIVEQTDRRHS